MKNVFLFLVLGFASSASAQANVFDNINCVLSLNNYQQQATLTPVSESNPLNDITVAAEINGVKARVTSSMLQGGLNARIELADGTEVAGNLFVPSTETAFTDFSFLATANAAVRCGLKLSAYEQK